MRGVTTFETMGTVVSLRGATPEAASEVRAVFAGYDHRYSLYDPSSVLSRVADGSVRLADTPSEVRDVYALALDWRERTGGAFTPHRPDGVIDLSGVVKALAIRDAGAVLDAASGGGDWMVNAGGDVLVRGHHRGDDPWSVGVVDPAHRDTVVGVVRLAAPRRAVATSGTAERGEHIWRRATPTFVQATVIADDIVTADVLATAVVAGDEDDLRRLTSDAGVDVLAFAADGTVWATPGASTFVRSVANPSPA
ncbi:FAD:protein FMN transferase [Curtobacterium sp. SORGH_AS_0776]|uniref:FAD:protein FMN transferase n=1 Tax=Curtobacterium sp. SORGH_AS_0776 TaxID=3041798 RepID=UPI0028574B39|nr:FAD:protein FMN transferase [Curtobacterium sp. SORGH_AS_0776]MDR6171517.1 thiamine biosynthesis lipoprotein [Curtobacterium sp. SORGH_AS_0776]